MQKTFGKISIKNDAGEWHEIGVARVVSYTMPGPNDARVVIKTKEELQEEQDIKDEIARSLDEAVNGMFLGTFFVSIPPP